MSTALDTAAQRIANGEPAAKVKQEAYNAIREQLVAEVNRYRGGSGSRGLSGTQGLGEGRPLHAGSGELDPPRLAARRLDNEPYSSNRVYKQQEVAERADAESYPRAKTPLRRFG